MKFLLPADHYQLPVEILGNPQGEPLLFLHGGPGYRTDADFNQRLFDLKKYRVIFLEQRGGSGSSHPGDLEKNTTDYLLQDIENLRKVLNISQWKVYGQSWGTTLALAYAIKHPQKVSGLYLKGVFLGREVDINWMYSAKGLGRCSVKGAENYQKYLLNPLNLRAGVNPLMAFADELLPEVTGTTVSRNLLDLAIAWAKWEDVNCGNNSDPMEEPHVNQDYALISWAIARVEIHYFMNGCFLPENFILDNLSKIKCPMMIFQGNEDRVCPKIQAEALAKKAEEVGLNCVHLSLEHMGHRLTNRHRKIVKNFMAGRYEA